MSDVKPVDAKQYNEALRIVVGMQEASVSLLQRIMKVGYATAARLIDKLEADGIISPYEGNKPRRVLIDTMPIIQEQTTPPKPPEKPPKQQKESKVLSVGIKHKETAKPKSKPPKKTAGRKNLWDELDIPSKLELIKAWVMDGKTEEEIYKSLAVSKDTFYKWKSEKPEFAETLKGGREVSDYRVEMSLFKRATGYTYYEETQEIQRAKDAHGDYIIERDDNGYMRFVMELITTKRVKKEVPPDTAAAFIWLKNRKPHAWKDRQEGDIPKTGAPVFIDDLGKGED